MFEVLLINILVDCEDSLSGTAHWQKREEDRIYD